MGIRRDDITVEQRIQIALEVLSPDRRYGKIRQLAEEYNLSRESIYTIGGQAVQVLQSGMKCKQHGPQAKVKTIEIDRSHLIRSIGQLALSGVSQRDTVRCLEEVLDSKVSLGWVNGRLSELETASAIWNKQHNPSIGESYNYPQ